MYLNIRQVLMAAGYLVCVFGATEATSEAKKIWCYNDYWSKEKCGYAMVAGSEVGIRWVDKSKGSCSSQAGGIEITVEKIEYVSPASATNFPANCKFGSK